METRAPRRVQVIDSHTGGEPTRLVISGGPDLGRGPLEQRLALFRGRHDDFRSAVVLEPRGSDVLVGALLLEPEDPASAAGVIFFNNIGYLGMCGHGTMGLVVSLAHLGRLGPGRHRIETPVGPITATLEAGNTVTVRNVPSYRLARGVRVAVEGRGPVTGDIAWGGNWFFLTEDHGEEISMANLESLLDVSNRIRRALAGGGITGAGGQEIDHIELLGPPLGPSADGRNFVLCPGGAYDRSPCGTGTSAKLACLAADGKLREGEVWRQEGIVGSVFEGRVKIEGDRVVPAITGTAFVTAEATLVLDPADPFALGLRR
jgi:4-hydroxyproline epimerase